MPFAAGEGAKSSLGEGQKLIVEVENDRIIMKPRPESLSKALMGSTCGLYGRNTSEVAEYVEVERDTWPE